MVDGSERGVGDDDRGDSERGGDVRHDLTLIQGNVDSARALQKNDVGIEFRLDFMIGAGDLRQIDLNAFEFRREMRGGFEPEAVGACELHGNIEDSRGGGFDFAEVSVHRVGHAGLRGFHDGGGKSAFRGVLCQKRGDVGFADIRSCSGYKKGLTHLIYRPF